MPRRRRPFAMGLVGRAPKPGHYGQNRNPEVIERNDRIALTDLYELAEECNAIRKSIQSLRDYLFKEGWEWAARFSKKCKTCNYEHATEANPQHCVRCDSTVFWEADPNDVREAEAFFLSCDRNGHTLTELLKMFEYHLNVADDAFLLVHKVYELDRIGRIKGWEVDELYIPDPRNFYPVQNPATNEPGGKYWICLRHRPQRIFDRKTKSYQRVGDVYEEPGNCKECGAVLYDVWYVSMETPVGMTRRAGPDGIAEFYIGDVLLEDGTVAREVIHESKYSIGYGYGFSPIISIHSMAKTLVYMERYVQRWYEEERSPRSAIFIPTGNPKGLQDAIIESEHRNVSQGGTYVPKFTYDPGQTSGNRPVQYVEFSKPPQEMQMLETSDYYYRRIGSAFGVAPVFHGNVDAVGLQQQGPTQWQVTVLAAQLGQSTYNDKVLPRLLDQLGVRNWDLKLAEVEEKDEAQKLQVELMRSQHAQQMLALGFSIEERDLEGKFVFTQVPTDVGGMGGGPGGGMEGFGTGGPPMDMGMESVAPPTPPGPLQEPGNVSTASSGGFERTAEARQV